MLELTECPVCASRHLKTLMTTTSRFDAGFGNRAVAEVNHILHHVLKRDEAVTRTVQCNDCGHIFLTPTFTDEQVALMYSADATLLMRSFYAKVGRQREHPHEQTRVANTAPTSGTAAKTGTSDNDIRHKLIPEVVLPHAKGGINKLLDLGGGTGKNISGFSRSQRYVYDLKEGKTVEGVASADMETARSLAPFDLLVSTHTFEHITRPDQALRNYLPLIAPGSLFYVEVPSDYTNVLLKKWLRPFLKKGVDIHWHVNFFSPGSLRRLFEDAGFEAILLKSLYRPYASSNMYVIMALFRYTAKPSRVRGGPWIGRMLLDLVTKVIGKPIYKIRRSLSP